MNYQETIAYLFASAPLFQNVGGAAYKEGLYNTEQLDEHLGHPHKRFKTIHIAGTNGKGSCASLLAAILQSSGMKVGLFTSPHLVDFRERIRVNGVMMEEQYVVDFVARHQAFFEPLHPSFFELTTAMAFAYFAEREVDVAVIEVGLGGRLDCTNIILPELCVITNISFDHVQFLGDTLAKIASEKAGIIKKGVPIVVGEATEETRPVFEQQAQKMGAKIYFAEDTQHIIQYQLNTEHGITYQTKNYGDVFGELGGICQVKNTNTVLCAIDKLKEQGFHITEENVRNGFAHVCEQTGLMGRWQIIREQSPRVICDTGHNTGGFEWITQQLSQIKSPLHIVFGMVNDKDISGVLAMLPQHAHYYFCQASVKRAMPYKQLQELATEYGLMGDSYPTIKEAYLAALHHAAPNDFIYIGGSSFVVADLLTFLQHPQQG